MGLFKRKPSFINTIERDMYLNNTLGYRDRKDQRDYQDELLSKVNAANEQYSVDGDLNKLIKTCEFAFIESDPPCHTSQNLKLADYYMKAGLNDRAWGYLNRLSCNNEAPMSKIRSKQAGILKKEKRYTEAVRFYMAAHLYKSEGLQYQPDLFKKDIQSCANKLKWNQDKIDYLSYLIEYLTKHKCYDEGVLIDQYKKALFSFGELSNSER